MINTYAILLFVFVFTNLVLLRTVYKFLSSLLQTPPQRMILSNRELIYNGLSLSYLITFLLT